MIQHEERRKVPQIHRTDTSSNECTGTLAPITMVSKAALSCQVENQRTSGVSTARTFFTTVREMDAASAMSDGNDSARLGKCTESESKEANITARTETVAVLYMQPRGR